MHVAKKQWQTVVHSAEGDGGGVRRLPITGGWLYQVERFIEVDDLDEITRIVWSAPVFVPFHGDGDGQ